MQIAMKLTLSYEDSAGTDVAGVGGDGGMTLETAIRLVRILARLWVGKHYFIPVGGHAWRGCLGYVRASLEIQEQAVEADIEDSWLVTAAGTGGTLAGHAGSRGPAASGYRQALNRLTSAARPKGRPTIA